MVFRFVPQKEHTGQRIDQFIPVIDPSFSRSKIRKIIDIGGVHVGGRRLRKCSYPVQAGERIEVHVDGRPLEIFSLTPENIIYQDPYIVVIEKPPGVETQPTPARYKGTLYEALLRYLANPFRPQDTPELGMVQRLDRDTSGILVFSTHARSHKNLTHSFASHQVEKRYLALVSGRPEKEHGEIHSFLARRRSDNRMKSVERGGKEAITRYRVLQTISGCSLLEVEILTGRSHQIRVHLTEAGHPLLGDTRYGGLDHVESLSVGRQMLHAWKIVFPHPVYGDVKVLEAPVPSDMKRVVEELS
ncbi:RluA family pseudouridine synthase [Desulfuromonas sp. AOP6]|uniref:RluA family pseudouridine synthase n=1 Tax=Desulfuromonas sp. AOP6 TaxID=1566351 RepID=UPI0012DEBF18|nr:RluA family pseudouridine synthase [Desulfuromonas sp. AOP6]